MQPWGNGSVRLVQLSCTKSWEFDSCLYNNMFCVRSHRVISYGDCVMCDGCVISYGDCVMTYRPQAELSSTHVIEPGASVALTKH